MTHRIQVVEDDEAIRRLMTGHLRQAGHWVQAAATVGEAMSSCEVRGAPDLFVLDIGRPGRRGFDLLDELRSLHGCADVRALLLAERVTRQDLVRGEERGYEYLDKPLATADLLEGARRNLVPAPRSW